MKFQRKFILDVFDNPHGTSHTYLSVARKNGKSALIAAILLAHLVGLEAKPSMAAIEATYTELATNQAFTKLSAGIDVDMRSIVRIARIL